MATQRNCSACSDLQENSAEFVMNGVTDNVEASLENNTGFNPASGNDNCIDLNNANDCLVGNMEDEVEGYEVCDWKPFMVDFIHNLWSTLKAIIASVCGLWTRTERNTCTIEALTNGFAMNIGEEETDGSYVVAGKGVSFFRDSTGTGTKDIELTYIGGALARVTGTLRFSGEDFDDGKACYNYDTNAVNPVKTSNRKGNSIWNNTGVTVKNGSGENINVRTIDMYSETELLFEIRIKKSEFPGLKSLISGTAAPTGGGNYQVNLVCYGPGTPAPGQHYQSSPTHTVPGGWIYVQARMISTGYLNATLDHHYTPRGFIGIKLDQNAVPCE